MKREYKKPLTEIVYLNTDAILGDPLDQDSTGNIPGDDPGILGNEGTFDEEEGIGASKSLWD